MKTRLLIKLMITILLAAALHGCGGGGDSFIPTIITGIAQAGLVKNGTVKVYAVNADGSTTLLIQTGTDANGRYTANVGNYRGPVVVKVFGDYVDEATNATVTVPEAQALQAALPAANGIVQIPVTPLTDIAVRNAVAAGGIAANIAAANSAVSQLFGVNITSVLPVAPTTAALSATGVTPDQKKYTTVLTALSQYVANVSSTPATPTAADLSKALSQISSAMGTGAGLSSPLVALTLQTAANQISSNTHTQAIVTAAGDAAVQTLTTLATIGSTTGSTIKSFRIRTVGSSTGPLFGLQFNLQLPAGSTVRVNGTAGELVSGVAVASGTDAGTLQILGKGEGQVLTLGVIKGAGFAVGEFATLYVDVTGTAPLATAFTPTQVKAVDGDGYPIPGISVELF